MRLLILTSQVSPYHNARYVGATLHFDDVHVLSTINAGAFPEFIASSLGHYTLHRLFEGRDAYMAAAASGDLVSRVKETIETIEPDAIAAAGWTTPESLTALAHGRRKHIPMVVMSESQADDVPRSFPREFLKRRVVTQFDAALVGGPTHADYAEILGIPQARIHLGYNAVDNAYFSAGAKTARTDAEEIRARYDLPTRYVLASSRFISKKNLPKLIHAYAKARKSVAAAPDLVILGDGPERAAIENAIAECRAEGHVHLPGFRGYAKLPTFYGLSEGFVHVSTSEQWGLVINEAMASGVPVVASDRCGATRTIVEHGVNGLVTATDVASIASALQSLFSLSPVQREAMGRAAASAISNWGPDRFGAGMKAAFASASAETRRGRVSFFIRAVLRQLEKNVITTVT